MDIKKAAARVTDRVRAAVYANPAPLAMVAEAADIHEVDLIARLNGDADFTVNDLVRVGGFLRIRPAVFMEGASC